MQEPVKEHATRDDTLGLDVITKEEIIRWLIWISKREDFDLDAELNRVLNVLPKKRQRNKDMELHLKWVALKDQEQSLASDIDNSTENFESKYCKTICSLQAIILSRCSRIRKTDLPEVDNMIRYGSKDHSSLKITEIIPDAWYRLEFDLETEEKIARLLIAVEQYKGESLTNEEISKVIIVINRTVQRRLSRQKVLVGDSMEKE